MHAVALGPVAGQQVDILDRQVELGLAAVLQFQRVVRGALDRSSVFSPFVARDAVVDVHHQIAGRQR